MSKVKVFITALLGALVSVQVQGQEIIPLTDADIARLDIQFKAVSRIARGTGSQWPATVIVSPDIQAAVIPLYDGILEKWQVTPGAQVNAQDGLAIIRSQQVMNIQQEYMNGRSRLQQKRFDLDKD
ncbi:MAG: hypothetical protein WD601_13570, partial [Pseudohongiellaceae bacterium]